MSRLNSCFLSRFKEFFKYKLLKIYKLYKDIQSLCINAYLFIYFTLLFILKIYLFMFFILPVKFETRDKIYANFCQ